MANDAAPRALTGGTAFRLSLVAIALVVGAVTLLFGEHEASMDSFDRAVATGDVHTVRVSGALAAGTSGESTVELRWRDGLVTQVSQVHQVMPAQPVTDPAAQSQEPRNGLRVVVGDLDAQLTAAHPGLQVIDEPYRAYRSGVSTTLLGWRIWGWPAVGWVIVWLVTMALLITGPQPWRATRWAWFWFIASPIAVFGVLAFLLLSGPTPLIPAETDGGRRLRGGWAFVIAAIVGSGVGRYVAGS